MTWPLFNAALDEAATLHGDPALGVALGREFTEGHLHVFGPVIVASRTLRDAIGHVQALQSHMDATHWVLQDSAPEARLYASEPKTSPVLEDLVASLCTGLFERLTGREHRDVLRVDLVHAPPDDLTPYSLRFRGGVRFGAERYSLWFPRPLLDWVRPGTDGGIAIALRELGVSLLAQNPTQSWTARIEYELKQRQALAQVDTAALAKRFGVSSRALRRRLAAEGVSLSELVDRVRLERAGSYLKRSALTVSEVADALGYADASTFHRAFRRWSGCSPSEYRARAAHESDSSPASSGSLS